MAAGFGACEAELRLSLAGRRRAAVAAQGLEIGEYEDLTEAPTRVIVT